MFSLESRKQNTKNLISIIKDLLYRIHPCHEHNAIFIMIIHVLGVGGSILIMFLFPPNDPIFYFALVLWVIIIICHFYFNGCIFLRLERELFNSKDWYGPWIIPFLLCKTPDVKHKKLLANNLSILCGIVISVIVICKIRSHYLK